jgi:hypothetical protein
MLTCLPFPEPFWIASEVATWMDGLFFSTQHNPAEPYLRGVGEKETQTIVFRVICFFFAEIQRGE